MELDTIWSGLADIVPSTADISNSIGDMIGTALNNTIGRVLYGVISAVNWFISLVFQLFEVFSGQIKVSYNGDYSFLTNVFFENSTISGIYWGMAIIGVVLCFAFTIISVIRKMFDGSDKIQTSIGAILGSMVKSLLIILSLNVGMVVILNFTNVLMQRVVYVFNAGSSLVEEQSIDFTDDQFATMGRVLNTIGNYSLNPSYNSRYNLNSCYNEIRGDMLYLQQQGVFDFYYITKDANGNEVETWQSALQTLVFPANLEEELKLDVYNEGVSNALLDIMETLETNTNFYPLQHYERPPAPVNNIPFDRVLFLACTYNAALNEQFNINPSHTDPLRGPYYNGEKSIYDVEQVSEDFNLLWGFNYIIFFLIVCGILKEMIYILLDCVARIYNMIMLYLVAPPFIALSPLDGGGKLKQWMLSFVVQCFGVFGTVIAMRLLLTFAPIVISTELQIFPNAAMDIAAKMLMIHAGCLASRKASAMFTGILADSAGWQSISAGNLRSDHDQYTKENEAKAGNKASQKQQAQQQKQQAQQQKQQAQQEKQQRQQQEKQQPQQQQQLQQLQQPQQQQQQQQLQQLQQPQQQQQLQQSKQPQQQEGNQQNNTDTAPNPSAGGLQNANLGGDNGRDNAGGVGNGGNGDNTGTGAPGGGYDFQPIPVAPEFTFQIPNQPNQQEGDPSKDPPPARGEGEQGQ